MTRTPPPIRASARALLVALAVGFALPLAAQSADATPAAAITAGAPIPWESLSEADRAALLEPIRERWERATPEQQQRYLERARFWASLTPEQKQQARRGMRRWADADPETRTRQLETWRRLRDDQRNQRPGHDTRSDYFDRPRDPLQQR